MLNDRRATEGGSSIELGNRVGGCAGKLQDSESSAGGIGQTHETTAAECVDMTISSRAQSEIPPSEDQSSAITTHANLDVDSQSLSWTLLGLLHSLQNWWSDKIVLSLDHLPETAATNSDPRDYLALERTYLAYMRTSIALVSFGVILVQLFFLKNVARTTGICLGSVCYGAGLFVSLLGSARYFIQQKTLERGKASVGGWDMLAIGVLFFAVVAAVLVIVIVDS